MLGRTIIQTKECFKKVMCLPTRRFQSLTYDTYTHGYVYIIRLLIHSLGECTKL